MQTIKPMECIERDPFDDDDYSFEIKFDGERSIFHFDKGNGLYVQNKEGRDITYKYPEFQVLANGKQGKVDGEIVAFDSTGKADFELLAQRSHLEKKFDIEIRSKKIPVTFMAFDLLSIENEEIIKQPLTNRKEILYQEFKPVPNLFQWSLPLDKEGKGKALFEMVKVLDLEGLVGKRIDSPYLIGGRNSNWIKIKNWKTIDLAFTKYTVNNAGIRVEDENGIAVQVAGFNSKAVKKEIDERGKVVIEVKYLNVTKNGRLRMPTFKAIK